MKFMINNSPLSSLSTGYEEKHTEETENAIFLGLQIDNHLHWKDPVEQMFPELSGACYVVRSVFHVSNMMTLKAIISHIFFLL
jgi:hypothetical protein